MWANVFDDWRSIIHFIVGGLSLFFPFLLPVFMAYELVEYCLKREYIGYYVGDLMEYLAGAGTTALAIRLVPL